MSLIEKRLRNLSEEAKRKLIQAKHEIHSLVNQLALAHATLEEAEIFARDAERVYQEELKKKNQSVNVV